MGQWARGPVGQWVDQSVAVLGGPAHEVERLPGGAPLLGHEDAESLVDDGAGAQRRVELLAQQSLVRSVQDHFQGRGGLSGQSGLVLWLVDLPGERVAARHGEGQPVALSF